MMTAIESEIFKHLNYLDIARTVAKRSTCPRRDVGCVLVDVHGRILATGYNGVPRGWDHCKDKPCGGQKPGCGLDECMATHAEINALLFCPDVMKIHTVYTVDVSPCTQCAKALANTSAKRIVFPEYYLDGEVARDIFKKSGIEMIQVRTEE